MPGPKGEKYIDLYRLAKYILDYDKLGEEHQKWCTDLSHAVNQKGIRKSVLLKPRGTYKSTVYTVALPIWILLGDPSLRILIANAVGDNARNFLSEITGHYLRNEKLEYVYRQFGFDGCPLNQNDAMSSSIRLSNCEVIKKEPNINTTGYGSSIVSQHYDVIIVDDLVDRSDRESPAVREGKKKWFRDLASLLETDGLLLMVGTRWHIDDTYHYIINELNKQHKEEDKYHVEIEGAYTDESCTVAAFPTILSVPKLEELKIDKSYPEFAANYMNNPLPAETQIFKLGELGYFDMSTLSYPGNKNRLYGFCDPALGRKTGDYTTFMTASVSPTGTIYITDAIIERLIPDKAQELIVQQAAAHKFTKVGIESNGFQELFFNGIKKEITQRKLYTPMVAVNNSQNKQARIESIQPLTFEAPNRPAVVRFREDWRTAYPKLLEQLQQFPLSSAHDDAPDSLQGIISLIRGTKNQKAASSPVIRGA